MKIRYLLAIIFTSTITSCASMSEPPRQKATASQSSASNEHDRTILSSEIRTSLSPNEMDEAESILNSFFSYYSLRSRFDGKPRGESNSDNGIRSVLGEGAEVLADIKVADPRDSFVSLENIVLDQIATFVVLKNFRLDERKASIDFNIPSNARYGTTFFVKNSSDQWEVDNQRVMRSSSGARAYYGRLFGGATCRDNTEMAYRWNFYASGGRTEYSGMCLAPEF